MDLYAARPDDELAALSYRYAAALDQRDVEAVLAVFLSEATLRAHPPGRNPMVLTGNAELAKLIRAVEYWPRTFHCVGQSLFRVEADHATGEVYCVANHFSSDRPGVGFNDVMYIRYEDVYKREANGRWFIAERIVTTDATERRPVTPSDST